MAEIPEDDDMWMFEGADALDDGIIGVVLALRAAGVKTYSSCQGGGYGWGHGYLRPTVCFEGDENEGERAERIATEAGYQVFQVARTSYTRNGERVGPLWEMTFVAGAACRAPKDRERIASLEAALKEKDETIRKRESLLDKYNADNERINAELAQAREEIEKLNNTLTIERDAFQNIQLQRDESRAQLEASKSPLTEEEWKTLTTLHGHPMYVSRERFSAWLASRGQSE